MTPVYVSGCFAWVHRPPVGCRTPSTRGVVLCAPLGREASSAHRPWVLLAERLADAGLVVLRFDYPGTGDSILDEGDPVRIGHWVSSIVDAAAWLSEQPGVSEIALCGLRAGATLAALAASEITVAATALLAPVISGRAYIREQVIKARAWDTMWMVQHACETPEWWEAAGQRLPIETMRQIQALDLTTLAVPPGRRVLVMADGKPATAPLLARLAALGAEVAQRPFPGLATLLLDDLENAAPLAAFATVTDWLRHGAPAAVIDNPDGAQAGWRPPINTMQGIYETPVQFGDANRLFGLYCGPTRGAATRSLLILNTGGIPHYGQSRFAVTMARRLARIGVASLRIDVSGIGDSDPATGHTRQPCSPLWQEEACAGLAWLRETVCGPVTLFGVCSGAYAALHIARTDPLIGGVIAVNLQQFVATPDTAQRPGLPHGERDFGYYLRRLRSPAKWRRLRQGFPARRIGRAVWKASLRLLRPPEPGEIGRTLRQVREWFQTLDRRGVPVLLAYSTYDGGRDELEHYFGRGGRRLKMFRNVRHVVLDNADHALSHHADREQLYNHVLGLLAAQIDRQRRADIMAPFDEA